MTQVCNDLGGDGVAHVLLRSNLVTAPTASRRMIESEMPMSARKGMRSPDEHTEQDRAVADAPPASQNLRRTAGRSLERYRVIAIWVPTKTTAWTASAGTSGSAAYQAEPKKRTKSPVARFEAPLAAPMHATRTKPQASRTLRSFWPACCRSAARRVKGIEKPFAITRAGPINAWLATCNPTISLGAIRAKARNVTLTIDTAPAPSAAWEPANARSLLQKPQPLLSRSRPTMGPQ